MRVGRQEPALGSAPPRPVGRAPAAGRHRLATEPLAHPDPGGGSRADLDELIGYIVLASGLRFDLYKQKCLRRRLDARMRRHGLESYRGYLELLRTQPGEVQRLVNALTVNVSRFFRNPESFRALERRVLTPLARARAGGRVRAWSAGTAGGEEAYTLAILWEHIARRNPEAPQLEVVATDIDAASLDRARRGLYRQESLADLGPDDLAQFFAKEGELFRVSSDLRRRVRFVRSDLTGTPVFRAQDLIICRNVLIYFERPLQEALCGAFLTALAPGGYLMLGKVEMVSGPARPAFEVVDIRERIFRKSPAPPRSRP